MSTPSNTPSSTSLWSSIVGWHGEIGSPFRIVGGPGTDEVKAKLGWADVVPTSELVAFLSASVVPDEGMDPISPMPGWSFPGLDYLVHEAEYLSAARRDEVSAWSPGWFPVLRDRRGRLIVTDTAMQGMAWLFDEFDQESVFPLADSMDELGVRLVGELRRAGCGWDAATGYTGVTGPDFVTRLRMRGDVADPGDTRLTVDLTSHDRVAAGI